MEEVAMKANVKDNTLEVEGNRSQCGKRGAKASTDERASMRSDPGGAAGPGIESSAGGRKRGSATGAGAKRLAPAAAGCLLLALTGCCEDNKREMERMADKYYKDAFACCKAMETSDPDGSAACFNSLAEWRKSTGAMILQWYQACLDDQQDVAGGIVETLRGMVSQLPGGGCSQTAELPDGRRWATGVSLRRDDTLSLGGTWADPNRGELITLIPPELQLHHPSGDRPDLRTLVGGSFTLTVGELALAGALEGTLSLGAPHGSTTPVLDAALRWSTSGTEIWMRLADIDHLSGFRWNGSTGSLDLRMAVSSDQASQVLLPPVVWLRIPVTRHGPGLGAAVEIDRDVHPADEVIPPAPGIADWNGDTFVDLDDWVAFFTAEPAGAFDVRDINWDGRFDDADVAIFVSSWQDRYDG